VTLLSHPSLRNQHYRAWVNPVTKDELILKITTRLEDPDLSNIWFAKLSQQLIDLRFAEKRPIDPENGSWIEPRRLKEL
jgi:hypothetical protein